MVRPAVELVKRHAIDVASDDLVLPSVNDLIAATVVQVLLSARLQDGIRAEEPYGASAVHEPCPASHCTPFNDERGGLSWWVREIADDDAYMALVLANTQGELHPLAAMLFTLRSEWHRQSRCGWWAAGCVAAACSRSSCA